jgi:threonine/homoserine/homoserine lactone efflux protein
MLPEPSVLWPFALTTVVIAVMPGPDMAFFLGRAMTNGRAAGLAALAGCFTGLLVHTTLVSLGLSALIVAAPDAFLALKVAGAGYLLWLAVQAVRNGATLRLPDRAPVASGLAATWASALAINLFHPKIALFFMTFLPQFVPAGAPDAPARLFSLGLVFTAIAFAINLPMVLAADRVAATLRGRPRVARALDWTLACLFAAFAANLVLAHPG